MRHPLRRHRWCSVGVDWNIPRTESTVHFCCCRHGCDAMTTRTYPGLVTIEAARLIRRP